MDRAATQRGGQAGRRSRIRRSRDFEEALRGGVRRSGRGLTLVVRANEAARPRLGLIVSRRAYPRAVDRNRFKRLVRECFRLHPERFDGGRDFVVIARGTAKGTGRRAGFDELCGELCSLAGKIGSHPAGGGRSARRGEGRP